MKSLGAALLLLLAASPQDARVRELVEKLSSDAIDAREEAAAALVDLGAEAVAPLEALATTGDAERRGRIAEILKEISRDGVLRKTWRPARRVDAAWSGVPLSAALKELAAGVGDEFAGLDDLHGPVTLTLRRASLWEALDALSRAAPGFTWTPQGDGLAFKAAKRPPYPAKASDEFLVWIEGLEYASDQDFTGASREWVVVSLNAAWTRGLAPASVELKATELLDGAGRSLLPPMAFRGMTPPRAPDPKVRHWTEEIRVMLTPGAAVDRVRGHLRLVFPRGYEDVTLPFGAGAPVKAGDVQVTVRGGTSTRGSCSFQVMATYPSTGGGTRAAPPEVWMIDDQGVEHKATGRGTASSFSGTTVSMHQNYEAPLPADRRPASIRLRLMTDVFERRMEFDFEGIPKP